MSVRLDQAVMAIGQARSRSHAADLIRVGRVRVNGQVVVRPSLPVGPDDVVSAESDPWVSRAAHKLLGALDASGLQIPARVLDAGASTGGFTQVLLSRGAEEVFAVDVGHGQLADVVRADPRVHVREGLNVRDLTLEDVEGEPVDLVVADVSFVSLRLLLQPLLSVLSDTGVAMLMIKPQFEVGRGRLSSLGVVRSSGDREQAIQDVITDAEAMGWTPDWRADSQLPGPAGNVEHFVALIRCGRAGLERPATLADGLG